MNDRREYEPEPPPYDPELPTGFANPRPTGNGDPNHSFQQTRYDPDLPDVVPTPQITTDEQS